MEQIPDHAEILRQLGRMEQSRQFREAPALRTLLRFLVETTLGGSAEELNVNLIARCVFARGPDFSNARDPIVRVTAMRLRKAIIIYYASEGATDDVVLDLQPGSYQPQISYRRDEKIRDLTAKALDLTRWYQGVASEQALRRALRAVGQALASHPEDPDLLAAHADLTLDRYKHGYDQDRRLVDVANSSIEKACLLDPANSQVQFIGAFAALERGDLNAVKECGWAMMSVSQDEAVQGQAIWMIAVASDPREMVSGVDWRIFDTAEQPGWIHHVRWMASYECGDYEEALSAAISFGMPNFFWGPLERAVALAQLGLTVAARHELARLLKLNPDFAVDPTRYVSCYVPLPHVMEHVLEGLQRAGLKRLPG